MPFKKNFLEANKESLYFLRPLSNCRSVYEHVNLEDMKILDDNTFEYKGDTFTFENYGTTIYDFVVRSKNYPRAYAKFAYYHFYTN